MSSHISHCQVISHGGETWFVNAKGSGLFTHTLKQMLDQINAMFSYHNKLFLLRFDLHQLEATPTSKHVSKFLKGILDKIKRSYKLKRSVHAWAREIESAEQQHYHCFIVLDGNKVQGPGLITSLIRQDWKFYCDGSIHWPSKRCYYQISRNDRALTQEAIYHVSYLAKSRGKGFKPPQSKNFGVSQLEPKI
ncbi:MAG: inovirus-type Gp2 protein [Colwellia sp.]